MKQILKKLGIYAKDSGSITSLVNTTLLTLINTSLTLTTPLILSEAMGSFDHGERDNSNLPGIAGDLLMGYSMAWTFNQILYYVRQSTKRRASENITGALTTDLLTHACSLPFATKRSLPEGQLEGRIPKSKDAVEKIFDSVFISLPYFIEAVLSTVILARYYDWDFTIIVVSTIAIPLSIVLATKKWLDKEENTRIEKQDEVTTIISETIDNFETIKYFNQQDSRIDECIKALEEAKRATLRATQRSDLFSILQNFVIGVGFTAILYYADRHFKEGDFDLEDIAFITNYLVPIVNNLFTFGNLINDLRPALHDLNAGLEILDYEKEENITDFSTEENRVKFAKICENKPPQIEFKDVCLKDKDNNDLLKDISFIANSGELIGVVGPSGCGKSTLFRIFFGFYKPTSGKIYLSNNNTNERISTDEISISELRKCIGYVPQSVQVYKSISLYDNVKLGDSKSDLEIRRAIRRAGLAYKDLKAPIKNDYSGGEIQRIGFARVFLRNAKIILIDEGTAALDNLAQKQFMDFILDLKKTATIFFIAHRLDALKDADKVICLSTESFETKKGEKKKYGWLDQKDIGTPADLMKYSEKYQVLYKASEREIKTPKLVNLLTDWSEDVEKANKEETINLLTANQEEFWICRPFDGYGNHFFQAVICQLIRYRGQSSEIAKIFHKISEIKKKSNGTTIAALIELFSSELAGNSNCDTLCNILELESTIVETTLYLLREFSETFNININVYPYKKGTISEDKPFATLSGAPISISLLYDGLRYWSLENPYRSEDNQVLENTSDILKEELKNQGNKFKKNVRELLYTDLENVKKKISAKEEELSKMQHEYDEGKKSYESTGSEKLKISSNASFDPEDKQPLLKELSELLESIKEKEREIKDLNRELQKKQKQKNYQRKKIFKEYIKCFPSEVEFIDLSGFNINSKDLIELCKMLETINVKSLNVSNNFIDDDGFKIITELLQNNTSIHYINLNNNCITKEGLSALQKNKIQKDRELQLSIARNYIEPEFLWEHMHEYNLVIDISGRVSLFNNKYGVSSNCWNIYELIEKDELKIIIDGMGAAEQLFITTIQLDQKDKEIGMQIKVLQNCHPKDFNLTEQYRFIKIVGPIEGEALPDLIKDYYNQNKNLPILSDKSLTNILGKMKSDAIKVSSSFMRAPSESFALVPKQLLLPNFGAKCSSKQIASVEVSAQKTKGGGDCAFHALGEWNTNERRFVCSDVMTLRQQVADAIKECGKTNKALFLLVQEAIKALVMENRPVKGESLKVVQVTYQQYQQSDISAITSAWDNFGNKLKQYSDVVKYVDNYIKDYCKEKNKNPDTLNSLKLKFYTCFNEDNTLAAILFSIPNLHRAYEEYNKQCSQSFNWSNILNNQTIINEYADFIATPGQWMLPIELHILAIVFQLSVEFYIQNSLQGFNKPMKMDLYNPGMKKTIAICFDGKNHYERMATGNSKLNAGVAYSALQAFMPPPRMSSVQTLIQEAQKSIKKINDLFIVSVILTNPKKASQLQEELKNENIYNLGMPGAARKVHMSTEFGEEKYSIFLTVDEYNNLMGKNALELLKYQNQPSLKSKPDDHKNLIVVDLTASKLTL